MLIVKTLPKISTPMPEQVKKYLEKWNNLDKHYLVQQKVIDRLFTDYPKNDSLEDVLLKSCVLNNFYSTNIFSIFDMAERIIELKIDQRLKFYDKNLVNELAKVEIKEKTKNFYSFATKYCSHHNPTEYPIYDSYVHKILVYFQDQDNFNGSKLPDLKNYDDFRNILLAFKKSYSLTQFNLLELDRYLWQLGKEFFPKNFNKHSRLDLIEGKSYNKNKEK